MKQIKTFAEACRALGIDPKVMPGVDMLPVKERKAVIAQYKLGIIARAINEGWEPDWSNYNQYKYYPWFKFDTSKKKSCSALSYFDYFYVITFSHVGSRLCYKSSELAEYAGKQFLKLYEDLMLIR